MYISDGEQAHLHIIMISGKLNIFINCVNTPLTVSDNLLPNHNLFLVLLAKVYLDVVLCHGVLVRDDMILSHLGTKQYF